MSGPDGSDVDRDGLENRPFSDEAPNDNGCGSRRELIRAMSEMRSNPSRNGPARCRSAWRCEEKQNTLYATLSKSRSEWRLEAEEGDLDSQDWVRMLTAVSERLGIKLS